MAARYLLLLPLLARSSFGRSPLRASNETDTEGCLITELHDHGYVWILHTSDHSMNWIESGGPACLAKATVWPENETSWPKRHGGSGAYAISGSTATAAACSSNACCGGPQPWTAVHPCPPPPPHPVVTGVSPSQLPVEGGAGPVYVQGQHFNGSNGSALCKVVAATGGSDLDFNDTVFAGVVLNTTTIRCDPPPAVIADGPGSIQVAVLGPSHPTAAAVFYGATVAGRGDAVEYYTLVDVAVGRRPFIAETVGTVLLSTAPEFSGQTLNVRATLPAAGEKAVWDWQGIAGGTDVELPLGFEALPANQTFHNDIHFEIALPSIADTTSASSPGARRVLKKIRRFHRVPPLAKSSVVAVVQVDHKSSGLLIDGHPWIGVGWYFERDIPTDRMIEMVTNEFAPRGVNQGMLYGMNTRPRAELRRLLDASAAVGFKWIWPLVEHIGDVNLQTGGPFDNRTRLAALIENVTFAAKETAVVGYYICDDCCGASVDMSLQAQAYTLLKELDPYHVTMGAVNCGDSWQFTDTAPSYLQAANSTAPMLPQAVQPQLQLSLDVVMHENYHQALQYHAANGSWRGGAGTDGLYRHGVRFEPVVNCPGADGGNRHWIAPKFLRSDAWLSAVTAGMVGQLGWIFPAWNSSYSPDDTAWRWQDQVELEIFGGQVAELLPALSAPFGKAVEHQRVTVAPGPAPLPTPCGIALEVACADNKATGTEAECEDCVSKAPAAKNCTAAERLAFCGAIPQPVRARGWAVPRSNATTACTYIVAVNTDEERHAQFVLQLDPPPAEGAKATRLFEAGYSVEVVGGNVADSIAPGSTNIYGIGAGCHRIKGAPAEV